MTELPLCRLVDLANSADCCHVAPGVGNDEQLGHFYVDNDFPVIPPGLPEEVYEVLDYSMITVSTVSKIKHMRGNSAGVLGIPIVWAKRNP